jgi:ParB/RepB/Spo0J family partition protein
MATEVSEQAQMQDQGEQEMGTVNETLRANGSEVLFLLPQHISVDERYNVRPWSGRDEQDLATETKLIEELAASIERDGQLDAGVVVPGKTENEFVLIGGHRRRRAIALINERRSASGESLLRMRVWVDRLDPTAAFRKAVVSNIQRRNLSPMDLALLIQQVKQQNKWEGFPGAKKTAQFLGVSTATVTQHEKLMALAHSDKGQQVQEAVHRGVLSAQSAFDLIAAQKAGLDSGEVMARAAGEQAEQNAKIKARGGEVRNASKIENPSVRRAIREIQEENQGKGAGKSKGIDPGASQGAKKGIPEGMATTETASEPEIVPIAKRTRRELLEFFESQDGPANGYPDSAVRVFVRYFVDKYAEGVGTDRTLQAKWDKATEKADQGSKASEPKEAAPEPSKSAKSAKPAKPAKAEKTEKAAKAAKPVKAAKADKPDKSAKPAKTAKSK